MQEDEYVNELLTKYEDVVKSMRDEGYRAGITEAANEFNERANSMNVNAGKREARDALIAFAARGILDIEQPTGNTKMVYFRS